jgi:uncharacterized paraquat-inducible protein A
MEMLLIVFWLSCGVFSAIVASSKGRSSVAWFFAGFFFGPLALLAVGFMPVVTVNTTPPLTYYRRPIPPPAPRQRGTNFCTECGAIRPVGNQAHCPQCGVTYQANRRVP